MFTRGGYTASVVRVLSLAMAVASQSAIGYYEQYFEDSLTFELDLQEHEDPNNDSNNLNLKRVFNFDL